MTSKHFQAILAKNQIAELMGTFMERSGEQRQMTNGDITFINSCLTDIEAYTGEGNQPSYADSFRTGQETVRAYPEYYGEQPRRKPNGDVPSRREPKSVPPKSPPTFTAR